MKKNIGLTSVCTALNALQAPYRLNRFSGGTLIQCNAQVSPLIIFIGKSADNIRLSYRILSDIKIDTWSPLLRMMENITEQGTPPGFIFEITSDRDLFCIQELSPTEEGADYILHLITQFLAIAHGASAFLSELK